MAFRDKTEEREYLNQQWRENLTYIRVLALLILLNTLYIIFVYYYYHIPFTTFIILSVYVVYLPISVIVLLLTFVKPMRHRWTRALWYTVISVASIMIGVGVALKILFCNYGVESAGCEMVARPVGASDYSLIYVIFGPWLVLNIMRNNVVYQVVAVVVMLIIVIWARMIDQVNTLTTWFSLAFLIGAQVLAVIVERNRSHLERAKFISEVNNKKLSTHLTREIQEKTKAQEKAKDEEDKRTQFTNMLFHEMRVPLNSVILSMNDLETDDTLKKVLSPDAEDDIERIKSGLNSIINIINDSLDFRKMTQGRLKIVESPFDYHAMLKELVRSMESSWKAKKVIFDLRLDVNVDAIPYRLLGDPNRLRQVVANYLSNAVKFTPNRGRITLQTNLDEWNRAGSYVWISTQVQDTGVGIRQENHDKLFKPFVQIDPEKLQGGKGSGLGLSIVASIVSSMGGTYGVRSEYGKGSTFWFKIKFTVTDVPKISVADNSAARRPLEKEMPTKSYHILVTDDDLPTRKIMRKLLERLGHTTDEAQDGIECIEKVVAAEKVGKPYDVLFLDNQMPRLDGLETLKRLRKQYNFPIIMLTGSSETETIKELQSLGSNEILLKPATRSMINVALRKVM